MHNSLTPERVAAAVRYAMRHDTFPGFCETCGRKAKQNCEPDAQGYPCQFKACGANTVTGAELLLLKVAS